MSSSGKKLCPLLIEPNLQAGYGHPKDNENKTYQVLGVESMEKNARRFAGSCNSKNKDRYGC